jgi:predicted 2-oxoglutarate/Fe(II)-dependent dioxygenase YbiX
MSDRWALPPLSVGEFAPDFAAPTRANPTFHFGTVAGRYVLLALMPRSAEAAALAAFEAIRPRFDDRNFCAFFVSKAADFTDVPPDLLPGMRWYLDPDGRVEALYGVEPGWLLLDPMLRVMGRAPLDAPQDLFRGISELPPPAGHAGVPLVAPVLVVPRVFDPAFCRELIAYYEAQGGQVSGVMRDIDGRTVGVLDSMKRRRDVNIVDQRLKAAIIEGLERALSPMIERTFHFRPTRLERYLIACYDAEEGGYFRPHRDNQAFATAHRKFAVSINLNAEEFEGGDLRFPEFGPRTYRPPTGGAVVFCCSLLHEATPVTRGRRYAVLPFLYDGAGEAIRQRNIDKLQVGPALVLDR